MREIKFKAYWKEAGMVVDIESLHSNGGITFFVDAKIGNKVEKTLQFLDEKTQYELMQFTGLYDKNGKEIYEGYIIQKLSHIVQDTRKEKDLYKVGDKVIGWDKKEYIIYSIIPNSNVGYEYINLCQFWADDYTKVEFDPDYGFLPFADSPENCGCCGRGSISTDYRVAGNIYQNHKLLK